MRSINSDVFKSNHTKAKSRKARIIQGSATNKTQETPTVFMVKRPHTEEVTGSIPVSPTRDTNGSEKFL
jgi:hypothetical protein